MKALLPLATLCLLALLLPEISFAQESPGIAMSQRMICYVFGTMSGYIGLLAGFCLALYGLWTIIQGSLGFGLFLILGGATVTVLPNLIAATLSGAQTVLKDQNIASQDVKDAYSVLMSYEAVKDRCDEAIKVDLSSLQKPAATPTYTYNPDGTVTVTNPDGTTSKVTSLEQALALAGQHHGLNKECVALVQHFASQVGHTSTWAPAGSALDNPNLAIGTPIAIFGGGNTYTNTSGQDHAALYMGSCGTGCMLVFDQHNKSAGAQVRRVYAGGNGSSSVSNNASKYQVIGKKA